MTLVVDTADHTAADRFEAFREAASTTFVPLAVEPAGDRRPFSGRIASGQVGMLQITAVEASPHIVRRLTGDDGGRFLKVGLQIAGEATLRQVGRTSVLKPGDIAVYDTGRPYDLIFSEDYRMLVLMFRRDLLRIPDRQLAERVARPLASVSGSGALLAHAVREVATQMRRGTLQGQRHVGDALLSLLAACLDEPEVDPRSLGRRLSVLRDRVDAYIDAHLADPGLDARRVAGAHSVSLRQLQKAFEQDGEGVAGRIRTLRLERCAAALADPLEKRTAAAVGARWGFPDPGHFSRVFRARYGQPPGEYRARHQSQ
ncbi:helix-turn-helix domain-containing protein [Nocardioides sp. YIM B13467]|uniref:AraC-like ligand-binding domain-containing protein n=1 Tax=Nocardioides sp. YIM B13467 TaxID=3366294 RepID=UPI00367078D2